MSQIPNELKLFIFRLAWRLVKRKLAKYPELLAVLSESSDPFSVPGSDLTKLMRTQIPSSPSGGK
jgi:hypothetical protein